jgi:PhnB protein
MNIYLNFDGNCKDVFEFYRATFGGEFETLQTFADGPDDMPVPDAAKNRVMHVSLPLGPDGAMLMGSDTMSGQPLTMGNNFSIVYPARSREECDALFPKLSAGGDVTMPLQETFWGAYFGSVTDKFGVGWMFNIELAQG